MTAQLRHLRMLWLSLGLILALAASATRAETEIIGGEPADPHQFPFIANIRFANTANVREAFFCGGVLIAARWVATAQHCVVGKQANQIEVVLGDHILDDIDGAEVVRSVTKIESYPGFTPASGADDIALLYLDESVPSSAGVIEFPPLDFSPSSGTATVAGWGATAPQANLPSNVLLRADVTIVSDAKCQEFLSANGLQPTGKVCAVPMAGNTCKGDSGGPLMINENGHWTVIGLTSYGAKNCRETVSYTPIRQYLDWISAQALITAINDGDLSGMVGLPPIRRRGR